MVRHAGAGPAKIVSIYPMARLTMKDADGWYRWIYERNTCEVTGQLVLVSYKLHIYRTYNNGSLESGEDVRQ